MQKPKKTKVLKVGRPKRKDSPQRVTLYLSKDRRKALMKLAFVSNQSMSGKMETMIDVFMQSLMESSNPKEIKL